MNTSIEYEKLTQEIYQDLLAKDGLTTEVKHNVKIQGKATSHQIDVFWEYKIAGVKHRVAIECKNYSKRITKGIISSFQGILTDIGNVNGIIVTQAGFQRGAKSFAEFYGIKLVELREPKAEDWDGRIRVIQTELNTIRFNVKKWFVQLDYDWCTSNIPADKLNSIEVVFTGMKNEIWVYNEKGNKLKNFLQLENKLPFDENKLTDNKYEYKFDSGYFKSENFGYVKIIAIHMLYDAIVDKSVMVMDSLKMTKVVLKDITTGEIEFIKKPGLC